MKIPAAVLALLLVSGPAFADEVVLRNGHKVVGIEREERDRIVVETGYGTVSFPREQVVSVTKGETPLHAWPVRYAEIEKSTKAADFTKLAVWARENEMPRYVPGLMRRAIELDPDNEEARASLGYVRVNGRWVTRAEAKKSQGQVEDGGRWVHPLEKELAERRRLESESRRIERDSNRKKREERRRRAREEAELQTRIQAAGSAPVAFDGPYRGRGVTLGLGSGYYGIYDLLFVEWILGLRGQGLVPPGFRMGNPRPALPRPSEPLPPSGKAAFP